MPIFAVRAHDTHHVIPTSNYGQYTMLIDWLMGTFRAHPLDAAAPDGARGVAAERSLKEKGG